MPVSACCYFDCCVRAAVIYLVDISECPDFNTMYELYDPCTVMFFFRNKVGVLSCVTAPAVSGKYCLHGRPCEACNSAVHVAQMVVRMHCQQSC